MNSGFMRFFFYFHCFKHFSFCLWLFSVKIADNFIVVDNCQRLILERPDSQLHHSHVSSHLREVGSPILQEWASSVGLTSGS